MVQFRRNYVPGGTYFFTVTLRDRRSRVLTDHIELLREAFRTVRAARPFEIIAIVVLPEHLHTVIRLPDGDADYSGRWRAIKGQFSHALAKAGVALTRDRRGEYRLWRRRFWEHSIRDERDLETHVHYIHYNPIKHGWVTRLADWPWSSFHRYVRLGWVDANWGTDPEGFGGGDFGEPSGG
jgi:putative transposase